MNYDGTKFGTAAELADVISRSSLREITPLIRVTTDPRDEIHPEGEPRTLCVEKTEYHGLWFNLEDVAEYLMDDKNSRMCVRVCKKLNLGNRKPRSAAVLGAALGNHCLQRRRERLAREFTESDRLRRIFTETVDDAAMQSFGYKPGTSVRALEKFFHKRPRKYTTDDYCFVRVPDQRSLDFAARRIKRVELWMRPRAFELLNAEPVVANADLPLKAVL